MKLSNIFYEKAHMQLNEQQFKAFKSFNIHVNGYSNTNVQNGIHLKEWKPSIVNWQAQKKECD